MPKSRYKLKRESHGDELSSDITLSAFANSPFTGGSGRMRKNALHHVTTKIKQLSVTDDDRAWDEKLEDLVDVDDDDEHVEAKQRRRKRKTASESSNFDDSGCDYPLDVWFLIAEHLNPEDIGVFAAICRTSNAVVNSPQFWFSLYKRFYRHDDGIPEILRPSCMVRRYGLRALVIRSLHFCYQPFVARQQTNRGDAEPHGLLGRLCVVAWTQNVSGKAQWLYSFKLKLPTTTARRRTPKRKPDLLAMLDDIHANQDDGCKLLHIRSNSYVPLPMITGLALIDCQQKMHRDFTSHSLLLQFSSGPSRYQPTTVSLQSVVNVKIFDWWHPAYSHHDQLHSGLISSLLPKDCHLSDYS